MNKSLTNETALVGTSLTINNVTINTTNNSSYTLTLPPNDGTSGQVLTTDGTGVLTWTTVGGGGGIGTVTSVSSSVPTFLSVAVTNPTTTPAIAITLSGTALPIANGGTGLTSAGSSGQFLASTGSAFTLTNVSQTDYISSVGTLILTSGANRSLKSNTLNNLDKRTRSSNGRILKALQTMTDASVTTTAVFTPVAWSPLLNLGVCLNTTGQVFTTTDGLTFTTATLTGDWRGCIWVAELGLFVASNRTSTTAISTSPDGVTWTSRTTPAGTDWYNICWSAELGIIVASRGSSSAEFYTSPDAITWTVRTSPVTDGYNQYSLTWSPELSLFVQGASSQVITSSDGITWTATAQSFTTRSNAWSAELGLFVMVRTSGSQRSAYSTNGTTWTLNTNASIDSDVWVMVMWVAELSVFIAAANSAGVLAYSFDGKTWTKFTYSGSGTPNCVSYIRDLKKFLVSTTAAFVKASAVLDPVLYTIPVTRGGTGVTTSTGTGNVVLSAAPTLTGTTTAGALTLSTPLAVTSGGTGTASIGTTGQYVIVNAGANGYSFTTGPGGGGVSQVGLANDTDMDGFMTISSSSSNPITSSGTFTMTMAAAPVITGNTTITGTLTSTSSIAGTNLNLSGLTASLMVGTDGSKNLVSITTTGTGSVVLANTPTLVTPVLGVASATSLTLSTPLAVAQGGTGVTTSTGTGSVVLSIGPTFTSSVAATTPLTTSNTDTTGPVHIGEFYAPNLATGNTSHFQIGKSSASQEHGNIRYTHNTTVASRSLTLALQGGGALALFADTAVASTLNTSLIVTGTVTSTTLNATGLTASSAVATDGSKNLVSVTNTGSGNNVLAVAPTLTSSSDSVAPLTLTNTAAPAGAYNLLYSALAPNTVVGQGTYSIQGVNSTAGNCFGTNFYYAGSAATTNAATLLVGTNYFTISNAATTPFSFNNGVSGTSLTLSTPLGTASGGTGLATVGTNGQVLTIVGGVPAWSNSGGGTVTNIGMTVPSFLSVTPSSITGSGTFALTYNAPLPVANGGTGSSSSTGAGAVVLASAPTLASPTFTNPVLGNATAGYLQVIDNVFEVKDVSSDLTLSISSSNSATVVDIEAYTTSSPGSKQTVYLNQYGGLVKVGAGGLIADAFVGSTGTGYVYSSTFANDACLIMNSTSSGQSDLQSTGNFFTGTRPLYINRAGGSVVVGSGGLTVTSGGLTVSSGGLAVTGTSTLGTTTLGTTTAGSTSVSTLNASGLVTAAAGVSVTSGNIALSGTGNYVSTSTNNTPINIATGQTTTYVQAGNANSAGNSALLQFDYVSSNAATNATKLGFAGGGGSNLKIYNSTSQISEFTGNLNVTGYLMSSSPRWGSGYLDTGISVPVTPSSILIPWATSVNGPLTRTAEKFTNSTGVSIVVQVSFILIFPASATNFSVIGTVRKNGTTHYGYTPGIGDINDPNSISVTTIVPLANTDYFEIEASVLSGALPRAISYGTENSFASVTQMSYYILN